MKERRINLTAYEVCTLLDHNVADLWRPMKPQPQRDNVGVWNWNGHCFVTVDPMDPAARLLKYCPHGVRGDTLCGLETWQTHCDQDHIRPRDLQPTPYIQYPATYDGWVSKRRPAHHMPWWASRLSMQIVQVLMDRRDGIWGWRLTVKRVDKEIHEAYINHLRNGANNEAE